MRVHTRAGRAASVCSAGLIAALTACGGGGGSDDDGPRPGVPDLEASLEFTATIEGRITDGETGEPLEGITVELSALGVAVDDDASSDEDEGDDEGEADAGTDAGDEEAVTTAAAVPVNKARTGLSTTTDENGEWQLNVNTPGSHTLVHHGTAENGKDYARTRQTLVVDPNNLLPESATGQYIIGITSDREMYPKDGTLSATVFGDNRRDVIAGARVLINYTNGAIADPDLPTEATTDDEGKFELMGLPSGVTFQVQVRPVDRDDDGILDTANTVRNMMVYSGASTETFIGPVGALVEPRLLWTNADSMRTFPIMPEFEFVFSHPMDTSASSADITLWDWDGNEIPTTQTWSDDYTLMIAPASSLRPGRNYELEGWVYSQEPSRLYIGDYDIRTEGGADEQPTPAVPVLLSDPQNLDFYTNDIRIGVMPLQDIETFVIYARTDTSADWIEVQRTTPNGYTPYQAINVNISGSEMTQVTTPRGSGSLFSHGGPLYLAVAAEVGGVPGPLSPALEVVRETCLNLAVETGTTDSPPYADNRGGLRGKPLVIALTALGSEWLADDVDPELTVTSSSLVTDPLTEDDFEMVRVSPWSIEWRAMLPVDADAQFLEYAVSIDELTDVGGNGLCDDEGFSGSGMVPTNASSADIRWGFEDDAQGWTANGDFARGEVTYTGSLTLPSGGATTDSDVYYGTGLAAQRSDATDSVLRSPTFLTPENGATLYYRYFLNVYVGDIFQVYFVNEDADGAETLLMTYTSGSSQGGWYSTAHNITGNTHGYVEFRYAATDSTGTAVEAGAFVDSVTITGTTNRDVDCPDLTSCPF